MPFHFLDLPGEIRIHIYEVLLADSTLTVQNIFIRKHFQTYFRSKTPPLLNPTILLTCRQIHKEGSPILYGKPHFETASCTLGIEKLCSQIGTRNFSLIKRLTLDPVDHNSVATWLISNPKGGLYRNLESLSTTAHRIVDLNEQGWEFRINMTEMTKRCLFARQIVQSHPILRVLGQDSRINSRSSRADAIDDSNDYVKWRFVRSIAELTPGEHLVDIERLLELSLMLPQRRDDMKFSTTKIPEPLLLGIKAIVYA